MTAIRPEELSSSTDDDFTFCGLKKKKSTRKLKNKKHLFTIIQENEELKAENQRLGKENRELRENAEEKDKRLFGLLDRTVTTYNITDNEDVFMGDNNTYVINDGEDIIERLEICMEQICSDLKESTSEQAQIAVQLQTMEKIVQDVHNKVSCLGMDNAAIQGKLESIENLLDVAKSRSWNEVALEKGILQIKDWIKISSIGEMSRITFAVLPDEGKRLAERLAAMYGSCLSRLQKVLETSNSTMFSRTSLEHPEDICAKSLVNWIRESNENTPQRLYELLTDLDKKLIADAEKKIREKAEKTRSVQSIDKVLDDSDNERINIVDNYF